MKYIGSINRYISIKYGNKKDNFQTVLNDLNICRILLINFSFNFEIYLEQKIKNESILEEKGVYNDNIIINKKNKFFDLFYVENISEEKILVEFQMNIKIRKTSDFI